MKIGRLVWSTGCSSDRVTKACPMKFIQGEVWRSWENQPHEHLRKSTPGWGTAHTRAMVGMAWPIWGTAWRPLRLEQSEGGHSRSRWHRDTAEPGHGRPWEASRENLGFYFGEKWGATDRFCRKEWLEKLTQHFLKSNPLALCWGWTWCGEGRVAAKSGSRDNREGLLP